MTRHPQQSHVYASSSKLTQPAFPPGENNANSHPKPGGVLGPSKAAKKKTRRVLANRTGGDSRRVVFPPGGRSRSRGNTSTKMRSTRITDSCSTAVTCVRFVIQADRTCREPLPKQANALPDKANQRRDEKQSPHPGQMGTMSPTQATCDTQATSWAQCPLMGTMPPPNVRLRSHRRQAPPRTPSCQCLMSLQDLNAILSAPSCRTPSSSSAASHAILPEPSCQRLATYYHPCTESNTGAGDTT